MIASATSGVLTRSGKDWGCATVGRDASPALRRAEPSGRGMVQSARWAALVFVVSLVVGWERRCGVDECLKVARPIGARLWCVVAIGVQTECGGWLVDEKMLHDSEESRDPVAALGVVAVRRDSYDVIGVVSGLSE